VTPIFMEQNNINLSSQYLYMKSRRELIELGFMTATPPDFETLVYPFHIYTQSATLSGILTDYPWPRWRGREPPLTTTLQLMQSQDQRAPDQLSSRHHI
jgi:hypothetical protein